MRHLYFFGEDTPLNYLWEKALNMCKIKKKTIKLYEARLNSWYEEGCEIPPPPFKSGPLLQFSPPPPPPPVI